jgi:hypothetical protein
MRWGAFFATTLIIIIIIFIQWPRIKQYSKKDKWAFFILIFIGWGLSMFDLPNMAGPTTWIKALFKPFAPFME